jgi:acyl carrier protein phosphodiesterase
MNYLAHLRLAEPTEDSRLGGLIGDFMAGMRLEDFPPGIRRGIERHRRIDRLTDGHPVFRRSRGRLAPALGRFSGIAVDIAYDHFLAADWNRWYPGEALTEFVRTVYDLLQRRRDELPPRLRAALPWLVGEDWLGSYAHQDHLERVFAGMARRSRRTGRLAAAPGAIRAAYDGLAADFAAFFPSLRAALAAEPDPGSRSESESGPGSEHPVDPGF